MPHVRKYGQRSEYHATADVYDSSSIKVLEGLEAVRLRPAMYIGSTGEMGLHHLVYEVVDNSVDEALAGYCTEITVTIHDDNSVTVIDNGRGIPVDLHEEEGVSAAQVVMTKLHAGGKFDSKSYKVSGGLHGVGVSVVNALSERLELEIWREGYTWQQEYACGVPKAPLAKAGKAGRKTGTRVTFKPDVTIMEATEFNYDTLAQRLRELAFLNKGLKITLTDERVDPEKKTEFLYTGGISEFIKHLNRGKTVLHDKPIHFEADREMPNNGTLTMEVALQYNDGYSENVFSFANNINTVDGGTHLSGFRSALTRTINAFGQQAGLFKDVKENLTGDDVREGPDRGGEREGSAAAVRRPDQGQAEQRHRRLHDAVRQRQAGRVLRQELRRGAQDRRQGDRSGAGPRGGAQGPRPDAAQGRARFRRPARQAGGLPGEGSGACASCSWWRANRPAARPSRGATGSFQAILPLKGKILNVEKARYDKMLAHEEIRCMITALGTGIGKDDFDLAKLRYGKIIIMTDADVDGSHIRTLLLTFFFRHMNELITRGNVFIAQPPLYRIKKGKSEKYIKDEKEFTREIMRRATENLTLEIQPNGNGTGAKAVLEGVELRTFLLNLDEYEQMFHKVERRLRDARVVEALANVELKVDYKAEFQEEANLRPVLEALKQRGSKPEMRRDEEHSSYAVVFHDSTNAERSIGLALAAQPEYRRFRALARADCALQRAALRGGEERASRDAAELAGAAELRQERRQEGRLRAALQRAWAK